MPADPKLEAACAEPPLVLLPGTLCDHRIFQPLLHALNARDVSIVLTIGAESLEQAAEQVLRQSPERFALLGFSLGGMVAMETALRAPDRVRGLVLLSTTPLAVPPERHRSRHEAATLAAAMTMQRFVREHLWPDYGGAANDTLVLPLLQDMAEQLGPAAFAQQTRQALGRSDFRSRLSAVRCPTLIMSGDEDTLCPPEAQQHLSDAIVPSTLVLLSAGGHFAVYERADEIASGVAAWFHTVSLAEHSAASRP